jgi:hypothetical protein
MDMSTESDTGSLGLDPAIENVEFKITVRASQEELVRAELRKADVEPQLRRVYFFDTQELPLYDAGVVLRARVTRDAADDSTVKLRPVVPAEIDRRWRETDGFEIELDMVGDTPVCSAKLEATQRRDEIDQVAAGERRLRTLFSEDQERLIGDFAPIGLSWHELSVLGPVDVRKWELEPAGFPHEVTVEEWVLPDESDLIELSFKVAPGQAVDGGRAFRALLAERGLDPYGDQQAKARTVLEFFTAPH